MLTSLYVEGTSFLHRMSVRAKLAGLMIIGLALFLVANPVALGFALLVTATLYLRLGLGVGEAFRRLRPVLITIAFFGLVNVVVLSPHEALTSTLRLLAILFLAASVTATTTIADFIDTITALLVPLERLGLMKAADGGLAFGLVLRFVPDIALRYAVLKEAHAARGLTLKPQTILGPLIISTLKEADSIAEAIDARGIRGQ
ncbi:biotin transport system permease protein [Neorhizobium galegae]|uniref:energy-coupling factor transporter transmembrane component T family protein n=1 Tax=Neorhizobium galegae TaxID=399 RepID=UPI001AE405E6|nr:energy-coupling factor transporter transmembrane protein EcfT [Neorhizobium galegae]MBP2547769.1 biotin transport system permease protein [Neorhizobium galegae]